MTVSDIYDEQIAKQDQMAIDVDNFNLEEEIAKYSSIVPSPFKLAIRLYIKPLMTAGGIILPFETQKNEIYTQPVGLVVAMGSHCYSNMKKFEATGPWCKVGDWVVFPRNCGTRYSFGDIPLFFIFDDAVEFVINDPRNIT